MPSRELWFITINNLTGDIIRIISSYYIKQEEGKEEWIMAGRKISISEEVWEEIAKRGKFGETEDDVLRRVFEIEPDEHSDNNNASSSVKSPPRSRFATDRMHAKVYREGAVSVLKVRFHRSGKEEEFDLPTDKSDKRAIRLVLESALSFGEQNGASRGQLFAIRKALTEDGFHLTK